MKLSVIIPMYNEGRIIENTARTLCAYLESNFSDFEVIFSDDGSTDDSANIVKSLKLPCVRVLEGERNRGKGYAVRRGMLSAKGDICLFTDADLAYGVRYVAEAVSYLTENPDVDVVVGSRNIASGGYDGYTPVRKFMSKAYVWLLRVFGNVRLSDSQCGFKAFRASAARDIFEKCSFDGFSFDFEVILIAYALGINIAEMPVKVINHRDSSIRPLRDALRMLGDVRKIKKSVLCKSRK